MKASALRRDDAALPFSFFVSVFGHALLLLLVRFAVAPIVNPVEYIYPTVISYQVFPEAQKFLRFSREFKTYSDSRKGVAEPVTGDIRVEPEKLNASRKNEAQGASRENIPTIDERKFFGKSSDDPRATSEPEAGGPSRRPQTSQRASHALPEGPDALVRDDDPEVRPRTISSSRDEAAGGRFEDLRAGARSAAERPPSPGAPSPLGQRGVLEAPEPSRLKPTTPQAGKTRDPRPTTDAIPTGPNVTDLAPELPRPSGDVAAPPLPSSRTPSSLGPRKLLYQKKPQYPDWAERDHVQAKVTFYITVNPDGRVSRARLAVSSGYADLDRLAEEAVRQWLYEPRAGQSEERKAVVDFVLR